MMNEPISSIMTRQVVTVLPSDNLETVKDIFSRKRIHHVPVVEKSGKLVGILTTSDLFWLNKSFDDYEKIRVRDVMTHRIAKLELDDKVGTAAEIFLENRFHALPIVDENDHLLGIVTTFDVLKYEFEKEYPKERTFTQ
ncbi:MAG: hypothetical protein RL757_1064 [Bacteroidota bacterium]|jgi:CBS domain-containing protein